MNGLITIPSASPAKETITRIEELLKTKGFTVFSKISHSDHAAKNGRELRPTELIIFGNPKSGGTGLMQDQQSIAIDLPAKILAWEDANEKSWITYNDMTWLANRHNLSESTNTVTQKLNTVLKEVSETAAKNS